MSTITELASNEILQATLKEKINEIAAALNGDTATVSQAIAFNLLSDLPTSNPGPTGFWLNSGVVTKGT